MGDPLPTEAGLADELGVSRTVVREALRALAALGVVDLGNGRRARVGQSTTTSWGSFSTMRCTLIR